MAKTLESKLDPSNGSTACWRVLRRAVTTPSAKLTVTAQALGGAVRQAIDEVRGRGIPRRRDRRR